MYCKRAPVFCNGDCALFTVRISQLDYTYTLEYNLHSFINEEWLEE